MAPSGGRSAAVLIVDGDRGASHLHWALTLAGYHVEMARTGAEGIAIATEAAFDLLVIEYQLPDILGTDVVRMLCRADGARRFVIVGASLTVSTTVEAMKLGALDVLEKPVAPERLLPLVVGTVEDPRASNGEPHATARHHAIAAAPTPAVTRTRRQSAAERWAAHVIKACESESDLKTLEDWAKFVGVSYSTLCESCRLIRIRPHDARDLLRLLRAVLRARREGCHPAVLLDISDRRTLKHLLERAGIPDGVYEGSIPVDQFFALQRFVARPNEGLTVLQTIFARAPRR